MSYKFLFDLALILISTKLLGLLTSKIQMPQVVGALLAGLIFGPAVLDILHETEFINQLAELGVIVIMFSAGMGTSIRDLKKSGLPGFLVALCGVIVPLIAGTAVAWAFTRGQADAGFLKNVFIGVILTATSVSITVETLKEIGKLSTKVGNIILAAAIIDDVLGLIALTIVTSFVGDDVNVWLVLLKIVLFFVAVVIVGLFLPKLLNWYAARKGTKNLHRYPILAFVICLVFAYCAEEIFGVADIIGAFAAGLIIANTTKAEYIESKFQPVQYLLLTPIFFASIGIKVVLPEMTWQLLWLSLAILAAAILSKIVGCGLGAKLCRCSWKESLQTGVGMVCRGEVALIVANKGLADGLMPQAFFGPVIIMVIGCSILTPILLKLVFHSRSGEAAYAGLEQNDLADRYAEREQLDVLSDQLLTANRQLKEQGEAGKPDSDVGSSKD